MVYNVFVLRFLSLTPGFVPKLGPGQLSAVVTTCACLRVAEWPRIEWAIAPEVGAFSVQLRPPLVFVLTVVDGVYGYALDDRSVLEQALRVFNEERYVWIPANDIACFRNQAVCINTISGCLSR